MFVEDVYNSVRLQEAASKFAKFAPESSRYVLCPNIS